MMTAHKQAQWNVLFLLQPLIKSVDLSIYVLWTDQLNWS